MRGKKTSRIKGFIKGIVCICVLLFPSAVWAAADGEQLRIEQARIYMPNIKLYCYLQDDVSVESMTAALDEEKLDIVNCYPYAEDKNGCDYYLLLDISKSIGKDYFQNIKNAVLDFKARIKDPDTMTIITFGDTVSVVAERMTKKEDITGIVNGLDNNNDNTHLFEALDKASQLSDKVEYVDRRSVALVITDGEDCSTNESTRNKALENLQEKGLPLYAMAVKETASGNPNAFIGDISDFARAAQGETYVFGRDEAVSCIQSILDMLNSAKVLQLKAESNRLKSVMQPLTLSISNSGSTALQVCPKYSKEDTDAPKVKTTTTNAKNIQLIYSEPVLNADQLSNYTVTRDGELYPPYAVNYNVASRTADLAFSEPLSGGDYTITFQNITDNSMNENPLKESVNFTVSAEEKTNPVLVFVKEYGIFFGVGALVLAAAAAVIFIVGRKKKKGKDQRDDKEPLIPNTLHLEIRSSKGTEEKTAAINDKLIIGRSGSCDVSLADELLSRQHFMLEKENGNYYITNLSQTNGTKVNGIEISSRCRLKNGDVVQAGALYITIGW